MGEVLRSFGRPLDSGTPLPTERGLGHEFSKIQVRDGAARPVAESCPLRNGPSHCPFGGACHTCPSVVQAKLTVSQPGDKYEEEADRTAERVMRMAAPGGDDEPSGLSSLQVSTVQRSCPSCEEDDEIRRQPVAESEIDGETIQAKPASGGGLAVSPDVQAQISSMRSGGQPLPGSVRRFFEPRFGYDLSGVRVHTDARAAQTANAVGAQAFAVGQSIMFANGRYAPETNAGKTLLAHELAHTIQQSDRRAPASTGDMLFRTGERPDWCNALVRFVEYEDANGIAATLLRYNPANSDLLVPLNHDIPSIYGPVDVDWMLRISFSQTPTIAPSIISPAIAQVMGYVTSHVSYFGAKLFWNTIRSFSDQYDFELGSIFQEANLNAPSVVVHWIHGESLRHIFSPALELCGQQSSSRRRERPAASVAQSQSPEANAEAPTLQTKLLPGREPEVTPGIASAIQGLKGGGRPIEPAIRVFMEDRFGHDFGGVRIHTQPGAGKTAQAVNARAFTVGSDIVFAGGQYAPGTRDGDRLLAHELTHVVQQGFRSPVGYAGLRISDRHSAAESEARTAAGALDSGKPISVGIPQPIQIGREEPPDAGVIDLSEYGIDTDPMRIKQAQCIKRLGGCANSRPGGIPSDDEIARYNAECSAETGYKGPDVTPNWFHCAGPVRGICGPDITKQLVATVRKTKNTFATWSEDERNEACQSLTSLTKGVSAWDITELHHNAWILDYRPKCATQGIEPPCGSSVQVGSDCHYAGSANYVIFGTMCKLCSDSYYFQKKFSDADDFSEDEMLDYIDMYKGWHIVMLVRGLPADNLQESKDWAIAGYRGWPAASAPQGDKPNCLPMCSTRYKGSDFIVHWEPHYL